MALLTSTVSTSILKIQLKLYKQKASARIHSITSSSRYDLHLSPTRFVTRRAAQSSETNKPSEHALVMKARLFESILGPIKDFPWKKAESAVLERLVSLGDKALKWLFVGWFILSFLSDFIGAVATNQELVIPIGLLIGCLMSDFSKETTQEFLSKTEAKGLKNFHFISTTCFFILVKFFSVLFGLRTRTFLLHVGNGGILQTLWLWRSLLRENQDS